MAMQGVEPTKFDISVEKFRKISYTVN